MLVSFAFLISLPRHIFNIYLFLYLQGKFFRLKKENISDQEMLVLWEEIDFFK